jgi:hypothetical protein
VRLRIYFATIAAKAADIRFRGRWHREFGDPTADEDDVFPVFAKYGCQLE